LLMSVARHTWPSGSTCWENLVLVRKEEMTIGIISQIRICFAIFLVIYISAFLLDYERRGG
jgi:hypothetical protein